jgi:hypothetical protein
MGRWFTEELRAGRVFHRALFELAARDPELLLDFHIKRLLIAKIKPGECRETRVEVQPAGMSLPTAESKGP